MNSEIKNQWVKALRSGEYKQGTSMLRYGYEDKGYYEHCCLGVLCDIYPEGQWDEKALTTSAGYTGFAYYMPDSLRINGGHSLELPESLRVDVGISAEDEETLINMNDAGESFDTIANWIEETL